MIIEIKYLSDTAKLPEKMSEFSSGYDLYADIQTPVIIKPFQRLLIPTGIAIAIPEGYEAQIRPRSGLAIKNGITVLNTPGTIDSDYRGEIKIILINLSDADFEIQTHMRIAQMVFSKNEKINFEIKTELSQTSRGVGGFGHTKHF